MTAVCMIVQNDRRIISCLALGHKSHVALSQAIAWSQLTLKPTLLEQGTRIENGPERLNIW